MAKKPPLDGQVLPMAPGDVSDRALKLMERQLVLIQAAQQRVAEGLKPQLSAKGENLGTELDASGAVTALNSLVSGVKTLAVIHSLYEGRAINEEPERKPVDGASAAAAEKLLAALRAEGHPN